VVNSERERSPSAQLVDEFVAPRPGMAIGDIGAGGGFYSFRYARLIGETGVVHAVDVDRRMTRKISYEATSRGVDNVRAIHVALGDLGLAPASVDVVMFNDIGAFSTCHPELNPGYFQQAAEALRPGGRMLVLNGYAAVQRPGERECRILSPEELIALSRDRFTVMAQRELQKGGGWSAYVVLFQRSP
jgi:cyclopropane fatty-acyl-phospholipid synthase-like methyltransferase